jgi:hypothetical protein
MFSTAWFCSDNPVLNSLLTSYSVEDFSASFFAHMLNSGLNLIYRLVLSGVKYH